MNPVKVWKNVFQFHIGSIGSEIIQVRNICNYVSIPHWFDWKVMVVICLQPMVPGFNSTLVRLEDRVLRFTPSRESEFQFHIGSIGSKKDFDTFFYLNSFNSTLVRLEVSLQCEPDNTKQCFNSTLVRLEVNSLYFWCNCICKFQFHIGSIGSLHGNIRNRIFWNVSIPHWFDWKMDRQKWYKYVSRCFNSTLVRLEAPATGWNLHL